MNVLQWALKIAKKETEGLDQAICRMIEANRIAAKESNKDSLGDRMKGYENESRKHLNGKVPVIIRLDGRSFHNVVKGCKKPYDQNLIDVMNDTAKYLCENIAGAKLAYVQSDEISILVYYQNEKSQPWFEYNINKIVSISAAMASAKFSIESYRIFGKQKLVTFDSRAFNVPVSDVGNAFLWRQQDCVRNSAQMVARSLYSHKECNNKNCTELKQMCAEKGVIWEELPLEQQRGRCIVRNNFERTVVNEKTQEKTVVVRHNWVVDNNIPIFTFDCDYIKKYVTIGKFLWELPNSI